MFRINYTYQLVNSFATSYLRKFRDRKISGSRGVTNSIWEKYLFFRRLSPEPASYQQFPSMHPAASVSVSPNGKRKQSSRFLYSIKPRDREYRSARVCTRYDRSLPRSTADEQPKTKAAKSRKNEWTKRRDSPGSRRYEGKRKKKGGFDAYCSRSVLAIPGSTRSP